MPRTSSKVLKPVEVLRAIGGALDKEGHIFEYELRNDTTLKESEVRTDTTLLFTLNDAKHTPQTIRSNHDQEHNVLILTGEGYPRTLVDLIEPHRNFSLKGESAVTVGVAVRTILDQLQAHLV